MSTNRTIVIVISPVSYDALGLAYAPVGDAAQARTAYGINPSTFDTTAFSWLLLAVRDVSWPVLLMEGDFPSIDTIVPGDWGLLARVADGRLYSIPQV